MTAPNAYLEEAIHHEAGHILIGKVGGLPIKGLAVFVVPRGNGLELSTFGTASYDPPDKDIPKLNQQVRMSLLRMIAGGVAGQLYSGIPMTGVGADDDRRRFERIKSRDSKLTLEEVAKDLQTTFKDHEGTYWQLVDLIRTEFAKRIDLSTGRFPLLTEADLEPVLKNFSAE